MQELVRLKCIKIGSKLRVRITSPHYNHNANCQFPRAIRVEGREYTVPAEDIGFSKSPHQKFFYRVPKRNVKICDDSSGLLVTNNNDNNINKPNKKVDMTNFKVYNNDSNDCCVCMDAEKDSAFWTCGHYYCCGTCANTLMIKKMGCPICRAVIEQVINKDEFQ